MKLASVSHASWSIPSSATVATRQLASIAPTECSITSKESLRCASIAPPMVLSATSVQTLNAKAVKITTLQLLMAAVHVKEVATYLARIAFLVVILSHFA